MNAKEIVWLRDDSVGASGYVTIVGTRLGGDGTKGHGGRGPGDGGQLDGAGSSEGVGSILPLEESSSNLHHRPLVIIRGHGVSDSVRVGVMIQTRTR